MKIPARPPDYKQLLENVLGQGPPPAGKLQRLLRIGPLVNGEYRHWDRIRHMEPPDGLTHEEWWLGIKIGRQQLARSIPLLDRTGEPFVYGAPDPIQRALHAITQQASGRLWARDQVTNPATRDRYIVNSLIEEAITSSQLEGASTTAHAAKVMLRTGRAPKDRSEQMILNNYMAMRRVQELKNEPLTPELVFELHRIVTEDTLDDPARAGAFRTDADNIAVNDRVDGKVLHLPPPADELPQRLDRMCEFANTSDDQGFMHPVVRAMILHFWLAHDHPFVDGNGRTARALFYWAMLHSDYWLAEFLSISRILNRSPSGYARSFLYTETDSNDLVYFLDYHLEVIQKAIDGLFEHLDRKSREAREVEEIIRGAGNFNHRQLALLGHALRHPGASYTFASHRRSHAVVYQTARTDLIDLARRGLLNERRVGRVYHFDAPSDLPDRLRGLTGRLDR
jgi:Fic family protein